MRSAGGPADDGSTIQLPDKVGRQQMMREMVDGERRFDAVDGELDALGGVRAGVAQHAIKTRVRVGAQGAHARAYAMQ